MEDSRFFLRAVPAPHLSGETEIDRDHEYLQLALSAMAQHPTTIAKYAALKALDFLSPTIRHGPKALSLPYALALGLIYIGAAWQLRDWCRQGPGAPVTLLWIVVAYHLAVAMVFFGGNRARLPVEPLLIVLASPALEDGMCRLHKRFNLRKNV